jgi:hypothetical protein
MMKYSVRIGDRIHYKFKNGEKVYGIRLESIMICEFDNTSQIVYIFWGIWT